MKIEIGRKYRTKGGVSVRILTIDRSCPLGVYPVVALLFDSITGSEDVYVYTIDGRFRVHAKSNRDLVEVGPYDDFKIDEPVIVWDGNGTIKRKRHFAGICPNSGKPMAWHDGLTSWTAGSGSSPNAWEHCERAK